jgi:hypothetical protein
MLIIATTLAAVVLAFYVLLLGLCRATARGDEAHSASRQRPTIQTTIGSDRRRRTLLPRRALDDTRAS